MAIAALKSSGVFGERVAAAVCRNLMPCRVDPGAQRYMAIVTLAEGESLRRMMHCNHRPPSAALTLTLSPTDADPVPNPNSYLLPNPNPNLGSDPADLLYSGDWLCARQMAKFWTVPRTLTMPPMLVRRKWRPQFSAFVSSTVICTTTRPKSQHCYGAWRSPVCPTGLDSLENAFGSGGARDTCGGTPPSQRLSQHWTSPLTHALPQFQPRAPRPSSRLSLC